MDTMWRFVGLVFLLGCGSGHGGHEPSAPIPFLGVALMPTHPNVPCAAWMNALSASKYPAISVVWGTFGDDRTCVAQFIQKFSDRPHLIEIYISNETWRDGDNTGYEGDLFLDKTAPQLNALIEARDPETLRVFRARAIEIDFWLARYRNNNTTILLSPGLEDLFTSNAYSILKEEIETVSLDPVIRNPYFVGPQETHGVDASCDSGIIVASEDGGFATVEQSRAFVTRNKNCLAAFLWRAEHQGRKRGEAPLPPRERTFLFNDVEEMKNLLGGQNA